MAQDEIVIDGRELLSSIKVGIRMPRAFGLRMWAATWLFQLAGWVSGTTVVIEVDDETDEPDPDEHQGVRGIEAVRRIRNLVDQAFDEGRRDPLVAHLRVLVPALALLTEESQEASPTHPKAS